MTGQLCSVSFMEMNKLCGAHEILL